MFGKYAASRLDIDPDGFFDLVAHGNRNRVSYTGEKSSIPIVMTPKKLKNTLAIRPEYDVEYVIPIILFPKL